MTAFRRSIVAWLVVACGWLGAGMPLAVAQTALGTGLPPPGIESTDNAIGAPMRLRHSAPPLLQDDRTASPLMTAAATEPEVAGEFERFVQAQAGRGVTIRRFGAELVTGSADARAAELSPLVPEDYVIGPGDEVLVTLWGSVDADLRLPVDRSGRITIPRVGTVQVSGVRYADLPDVVSRRVGQVFRNFQSSVSLGQLRGIRVFVTGFVARPGTYVVTSLSSAVAALMRAGGPSAAGTFRNIELRRGAELISRFDLYALLLKGDRSADRILQAGDVVHVGAVGTQIGFIGSVNKPAVLELKADETITEALGMVGGFTAVADRSRLAVERLQERNAGRVAQLELPRDERSALANGDVLRAFSAVTAVLASQRQNKRVKVEGEVARPADYVLPEGVTVRDAIRAAGGYTSGAYLPAAEIMRESVQRTQQENYERALRDMETDMARTSGSQRVSSGDDANVQAARSQATSRLIERLRVLRPNGRIVLQMAPDATDLPDLALEDGDRIYIPARPTTVGVFGSVFNAATYLHLPNRSIDDYLRLAGGPTKGADLGSIFVVRANGSVLSSRQRNAGWFSGGSQFGGLRAEPGDSIFAPEELDKTTITQHLKDWTQILSQFGFGLAAIRILGN